LIRYGKSHKYRLVKYDKENLNYILLGEFKKFDEFSEKIMNLFNISFNLVTKSGIETSVTPPLFFSFHYIDQDKGWNDIAKSFDNVTYFKNWSNYIIKYIVGYQNQEYINLKKEEEVINLKITEVEQEINYIKNFIINVYKNINYKEADPLSEQNRNQEEILDDQDEILDKMKELEKNMIRVKQKLSVYQNERYNINIRITYLKNLINSLKQDHKFANELPEHITCPFCGTTHSNDFTHKLEIIKDIKTAQELLSDNREELKKLDQVIFDLKQELDKIKFNYKKFQDNLLHLKEHSKIVNNLKLLGRQEIINSNKQELLKIQNRLDRLISKKNNLLNRQKELTSRKRSTQITNKLSDIFKELSQHLDIPIDKIKFRDFRISLKNYTGSYGPRIIYAYYISLYKYVLSQTNYPFKFLVIDTPNQQGQDKKNLKNIFSVLSELVNTNGQIIIGTETPTGLENNENVNLIHLTKKRKCLSTNMFSTHLSLFQKLENAQLTNKSFTS
jgi:hypothetical protein